MGLHSDSQCQRLPSAVIVMSPLPNGTCPIVYFDHPIYITSSFVESQRKNLCELKGDDKKSQSEYVFGYAVLFFECSLS